MTCPSCRKKGRHHAWLCLVPYKQDVANAKASLKRAKERIKKFEKKMEIIKKKEVEDENRFNGPHPFLDKDVLEY
jgi:hypothetical protein